MLGGLPVLLQFALWLLLQRARRVPARLLVVSLEEQHSYDCGQNLLQSKGHMREMGETRSDPLWNGNSGSILEVLFVVRFPLSCNSDGVLTCRVRIHLSWVC